jgi:hypothetical protein
MDVIYIRYGYGKGSESLGVWSTAGSVRWESVVMPVQKKGVAHSRNSNALGVVGISKILKIISSSMEYGGVYTMTVPEARLRLDEGYCGLNP